MHPYVRRYAAWLDEYFRPSLFHGPYARHFLFLLLWGTLGFGGSTSGFAVFMCVVQLIYIGQIYGQNRAAGEWVKRLTPVLTVLVQGNSRLFKPGRETLPALVLYSGDPFNQRDVESLQEIARRMNELKGKPQEEADLAAVSEIVTDERAVRGRRRRLPTSFTGGAEVYAADLWVERACLEHGFITGPVIPCFMERGERGAIRVMPWWIAEEKPQPARQPFWKLRP